MKEMTGQVKEEVTLVYLPFSDLMLPSMCLSLLKSLLKREGIVSHIDYANMYFGEKLGLDRYQELFSSRHSLMAGEFVFREAAFPEAAWQDETYYRWVSKVSGGVQVSEATKEFFCRFKLQAKEFIQETVARVLRYGAPIVAVSSMFQQSNAMIAFVRELKRQAPDIIVLVGGANCFDSAGQAFLQYIPEIDYLFLGEADEIFAPFCARLLRGERPTGDELPYGLIDRNSSDEAVKAHRLTKDINLLPYPDYDDYYATMEAVLGPELNYDIAMLIEGSRGCWWGEKHQCTFCGLNGKGIVYRQKTTQRLVEEIEYLLQRYPVRNFMFTDSVLSLKHMKELPELMLSLPRQVHYFIELKTTAKFAELEKLVKVGLHRFQPGIESLNDHVLTLMNKGNRAIRQIETMRDYRRLNAWYTWNLLCGFPGEKEEDYEAMLELVPKLTHLLGPAGMFNIFYHKSSVYERERERFGLQLEPMGLYYELYPLGEDFIRRVAYIFQPADPEEQRLYYDFTKRGEAYKKLAESVFFWTGQRTNAERLDMELKADGTVEIMDMRKAAKHMLYTLRGVEAAAYLAAGTTIRRERLEEQLAAQGWTAEQVTEALSYLEENLLLLEINGEYLALAVEKK